MDHRSSSSAKEVFASASSSNHNHHDYSKPNKHIHHCHSHLNDSSSSSPSSPLPSSPPTSSNKHSLHAHHIGSSPSLSANKRKMLFLIFIVICTNLLVARPCCECLKITLLDIPTPLMVGESAELTCNYDLEDNKLYSFKWYKDGIEFFRYVPREFPQKQHLKIAGINVDIQKSTTKSVYFTNVNLNTRGKYRCEISAEAPSFVTAAKEDVLEVNVLPAMGPKIVTDQSAYTVGDEMVVNCTADKSNLEVQLNFTINGEPISNTLDYEMSYSTQLNADSLKTAGLSLRMVLTPKHFRQGRMKLKCIAAVPLYNFRNEANLIVSDFNYRPEPVYLSSESQARSEAKAIHNEQMSTSNEWKIFSVIFSMLLHHQLQRVFSG